MSAERLEHKVVSGVVWSFAEKFLTMLVQMVVSIIVARRLMPEDFGVMAILTFFTSVALTIVDSGFSQTLIRKREPSDSDYRSVFLFNVVVALLLYFVLWALAAPIARFYGHSVIRDVAPVLFLLLPINSLCVVQTVMFTREFRFKLLSNIVFFASLVSGVVAVAMAVAGCGIWALVAQRLLQMGIKAVAFWLIRRWRVRGGVSLSALREMAPFSLRLLASDLIASIYNNVAQLFVGKIYSTASLGYYSQAQKLKDLAVISTVQSVQGVTYPALSKLSADEEKFSAGYERIVRLLSFVLFPAMLGLVAISSDMFMLLLGERWMPTVPYFRILALSGMVYPLAMVGYNVLKIKSDGRLVVRLEVVKRVVMTLVLCVTIPTGIEAVAWGMTAMAFVEFLLNSGFALRLMSFGVVRLAKALLPSLLLSLIVYFGLEILNPHLVHLSVALRLTADIALAVVSYIALAWALRFRAFHEVIDLIKGVIFKSKDN
ncbi:MAG: lipopolysaccharide biosynthesis protein [Alistipes sp.]|nr:lipopolysaccharide biosynthesis protein [Alistipes sp.]MBR6632030.1 lipopolysaccharide biosynthesis protein [Alistipes sp.]